MIQQTVLAGPPGPVMMTQQPQVRSHSLSPLLVRLREDSQVVFRSL